MGGTGGLPLAVHGKGEPEGDSFQYCGSGRPGRDWAPCAPSNNRQLDAKKTGDWTVPKLQPAEAKPCN